MAPQKSKNKAPVDDDHMLMDAAIEEHRAERVELEKRRQACLITLKETKEYPQRTYFAKEDGTWTYKSGKTAANDFLEKKNPGFKVPVRGLFSQLAEEEPEYFMSLEADAKKNKTQARRNLMMQMNAARAAELKTSNGGCCEPPSDKPSSHSPPITKSQLRDMLRTEVLTPMGQRADQSDAMNRFEFERTRTHTSLAVEPIAERLDEALDLARSTKDIVSAGFKADVANAKAFTAGLEAVLAQGEHTHGAAEAARLEAAGARAAAHEEGDKTRMDLAETEHRMSDVFKNIDQSIATYSALVSDGFVASANDASAHRMKLEAKIEEIDLIGREPVLTREHVERLMLLGPEVQELTVALEEHKKAIVNAEESMKAKLADMMAAAEKFGPQTGKLFDELNENVTSLLGAQGDEISELRVEMRDRIKFLAARLTDIMGEIGKKSEQSQTSVKDVVNEAAKCLSDGLNDVLIKVGKMTSPHVVVGSPVKTRAKAKAPVLTEKEPFEASSEILKKFGALVDQAPVGAEITSIVAETPNAVELISFALFFPLTKLPAVELLLKLNKANVAGAAPILESAAPMLILNSASDDGAIRDSATEAIEEFRGIGSVDTFNLLLATTGSEAVPDKCRLATGTALAKMITMEPHKTNIANGVKTAEIKRCLVSLLTSSIDDEFAMDYGVMGKALLKSLAKIDGFRPALNFVIFEVGQPDLGNLIE